MCAVMLVSLASKLDAIFWDIISVTSLSDKCKGILDDP
jgi:hypothetical protein